MKNKIELYSPWCEQGLSYDAKAIEKIAIDKGVYCTTKIFIGDYTHISPYVTIIGGKNGVFKCLGFNNIMLVFDIYLTKNIYLRQCSGMTCLNPSHPLRFCFEKSQRRVLRTTRYN